MQARKRRIHAVRDRDIRTHLPDPSSPPPPFSLVDAHVAALDAAPPLLGLLCFRSMEVRDRGGWLRESVHGAQGGGGKQEEMQRELVRAWRMAERPRVQLEPSRHTNRKGQRALRRKRRGMEGELKARSKDEHTGGVQARKGVWCMRACACVCVCVHHASYLQNRNK